MTDKMTIPTHIRERATEALATINAWNATIYAARNLAALTGRATEDLNDVELTLRGHGWSLDKIYSDLGQPRPQVEDWREGQR